MAAVYFFRPHSRQQNVNSSPHETVTAWAVDTTHGSSGTRYWLHPKEAEKLFAVRSCNVLSIRELDANHADVTARTESSDRAGLAITADWLFSMTRNAAGEWKIDFLTARE